MAKLVLALLCGAVVFSGCADDTVQPVAETAAPIAEEPVQTFEEIAVSGYAQPGGAATCVVLVCIYGGGQDRFFDMRLDADEGLQSVSLRVVASAVATPGPFRFVLDCSHDSGCAPLMEVESELPATITGNATTPPGARVWLRVENVGALGGVIPGPVQQMRLTGTLELRTEVQASQSQGAGGNATAPQMASTTW